MLCAARAYSGGCHSNTCALASLHWLRRHCHGGAPVAAHIASDAASEPQAFLADQFQTGVLECSSTVLQMVVEKMLAAEGVNRRELGRAGFEDRVWAWKREYGGFITGQLRRLGASCDWSRERFTLDEQLSGEGFRVYT